MTVVNLALMLVVVLQWRDKRKQFTLQKELYPVIIYLLLRNTVSRIDERKNDEMKSPKKCRF